MTRFRAVALFFVCVSFLIACKPNEPVLPGDLPHIDAAVLSTCSPYNIKEEHTCLFFSDSEDRLIRVYDATLRQFVLAPIAYAPLTLTAKGAFLGKLATVPGFPFLFSLDESNAKVEVFLTANQNSGQIPFGRHLATIPVVEEGRDGDVSPSALAVFPTPGKTNELMLLITLMDPSDLIAIPFNTDTYTVPQPAAYYHPLKNYPLNEPNELSVLGNTIVVSQNSSDAILFNISAFSAENGAPAAQVSYLPFGVPVEKIKLVTIKEGGQWLEYAVAIRQNTVGSPIVYQLLGTALSNAQRVPQQAANLKTVTLDTLPATFVFPGPEALPCCQVKSTDGNQVQKQVEQWGMVVTVGGDVQYLSLPDFQPVPSKEGGKVNLSRSQNLGGNAFMPVATLFGNVIAPNETTRKSISSEADVNTLWGWQLFIPFANGTIATAQEGKINFVDLQSQQ